MAPTTTALDPPATPASAGERPWVGRPIARLEDERLLTGRSVFVADRRPAGVLQIVFVRSPHAHARLLAIATGRASSMPGVRAVYTAADLTSLDVLPVSLTSLAVEPAPSAVPVGMPALASGRVRFAGEAVAAVVAESEAAALDAAEAVEVDYEPLPVVQALAGAGAATALHEQAPDNVLLRSRRGSGDVAAGFAAAAHVVEVNLELPRLVAAPMETRGALAAYDEASDLLTVHLSSQDPHRPRANLAAMLRRPPERVRVVVEDVGGGFGSKGTLAPEVAVAAFAAIALGQPVRWVETRSENFLAAPQGRGMQAAASLAVDAAGRFLALRARLVADLGAYLRPDGLTPPMIAASLLTGAYDIPAAEVELLGVATNAAPTGPYRGAGRPEGAYVAERLADLAAAATGLDPVEVRRRNLVPPGRFPYRTAIGDVVDAADFPRLLAEVCELARYEALRARHTEERRAGALVGLGLAVFLEPTGRGLWETATVALAAGGRILGRPGASSHGQSHETVFAQVLADALGVEPAEVEIRAGDSAEVPEGMGTFASRSAMLAGSALMLAADELAGRLQAAAAERLDVPPAEVSWCAGRAWSADGRSLDLADLAPTTGELAVTARFSIDEPLYASGAFLAEVEIDAGTGRVTVRSLHAVHDGGRILNPLVAEGQIQGGAVQGLGEALSEAAVYGPEGQLENGSFLSYGVLSAPEAPEVVGRFATPATLAGTPVGAKGIGESGATGVPAAVANAVADALAAVGAPMVQMPFTPERLWRVLGTAAPAAAASPGR